MSHVTWAVLRYLWDGAIAEEVALAVVLQRGGHKVVDVLLVPLAREQREQFALG